MTKNTLRSRKKRVTHGAGREGQAAPWAKTVGRFQYLFGGPLHFFSVFCAFARDVSFFFQSFMSFCGCLNLFFRFLCLFAKHTEAPPPSTSASVAVQTPQGVFLSRVLKWSAFSGYVQLPRSVTSNALHNAENRLIVRTNRKILRIFMIGSPGRDIVCWVRAAD